MSKHREKLHRLSFRIDGPTIKRLDKIAKLLAARHGSPTPSRTGAIRFVAQVAEALDGATMDDLFKIIWKIGGPEDKSGAPKLGEAVKYAVRRTAEQLEAEKENKLI